MTDPVERLVAAWLAWEAMPGAHHTCVERLDAVSAAGLPSIPTHQLMGAARRAGMSIPDAVQTVINEFAPREVA